MRPRLLLLLAACLSAADPPGTVITLPHFEQTWSDEFSQGYADTQSNHHYTDPVAPNPAVWTNPPLTRYNSNETQEYQQRQENVYIDSANGWLVLKFLNSGTTISGRVGTSGMVVSRPLSESSGSHEFSTVGRTEWRTKIPSQKGMFPALWLEGITGVWPARGEIDVMEYFGWKNDFSHIFSYGLSNALHFSDSTSTAGYYLRDAGIYLPISDPAGSWHIYAVERDANEMLFYYDGLLSYRVDTSSSEMTEYHDRTSFALMNLAYTGDATQAAADTGATMYVDYVREFAFKAGVRRHYPPTVMLGQSEAQVYAVTNKPLPITADATGDGLSGCGFTWEWQQITGPDTSTFADATARQTTVTFATAGSYNLRCIARDGLYGGYAVKNVIVTDPDVNTPPMVNCSFRTVQVGYPVRMTANAADDGLPSGTLTYSWWCDGNTVLSATDVLQPTVTCNTSGAHSLALTVSDGALSVQTYIVVTAVDGTNTAPTVDAGTVPAAVAGVAAALSGTVSDDGLPQNTLSQAWTVVSGPATPVFAHADWAQTAVTFPSAGSYVLRLTVSDGQLSTSADLTVVVSGSGSVNTSPVANAGADQSITLPATATLSGSATDDGLPAGSLSYLWTTTSGPGIVTFGAATSAATTATFSAAGIYVLQLAASDGALSGTDTVSITVNPVVVVNAAPVANAGADQSIILPATATLSGSATDDGLPAGSLSYLWSTTSGPGNVTFAAATSAATTATFSVAGTYILQLAASDGALSGTDSVIVIATAGTTPATIHVSSKGSGDNGACGAGALALLGLSLAMYAMGLRKRRSP